MSETRAGDTPIPTMDSAGALTIVDEKLFKVTAPTTWKIPTVIDLAKLEALPPAAKERETKQAADTFASTGRNVFVHYVTPILEGRRKLLLEANIRKKKYPKTAAQIWQTVDAEEAFFWHETARQLRLCMKKELLRPKGCLIHAGRVSEKETYIWHAEVAVAAYLNLPTPQEPAGSPRDCTESMPAKTEESTVAELSLCVSTNEDSNELCDSMESFTIEKNKLSVSVLDEEQLAKVQDGSQMCGSIELLDTLPDRFEYEQKMLYSHFARYDYNEVRQAEGKHQTAMLRQLADLFDNTGKVLFYYYVVPRLCKQCHPPSAGETVTIKAADIWRFLSGVEKENWLNASANLKKQLGDGDIVGLETLQLDSLDREVLRLHERAQAAECRYEERKGNN